ncbi:MAG: YdcF family protein [Polyangiaceae bacterium]
MKRIWGLPVLAVGLAVAASCYETLPTPPTRVLGPPGGYAPPDFDPVAACVDWEYASSDDRANFHYSYPEVAPEGCFVEVDYEPLTNRILGTSPTPDDCGYPRADTRDRLLARAETYERIANGNYEPTEKVPLELACDLPEETRRLAAATNGRTLRSYAESIGPVPPVYPYSLIGTFGYGAPQQDLSRVLDFKPGMDCLPLTERDRFLLTINNLRARRAADAYHAKIAPLVSFSGGAIHAKVVEAFMLMHLAACDGGVPMDRILVDPCANHTHTNFRNTGALVHGISGRTAYLVTDDFIQSDYMLDYTGFELLGGSIDQRSLRDFGYSVGAWRKASHGMKAGFWFTPYRFWAEAENGLGRFTCAVDAPIAR